VVSGTTGIDAHQITALKKAAQKIPILWASNMSLGVAVVTEALEVFSRIRQFDFQIEEFHHNRKEDRPSGTAKSLQQKLEQVVGRALPEAISIRGGGIFGIHKVHAMSEEEHIVFEHTALNRAVFARGAVEAAQWLCSKKKGYYSMRDVLYNERR
jgi:4-hydroxy-tetrahydrodipicolinate reductase